MENYNPLLTESKWQSLFEKKKLFVTKNSKTKKFYCLEMFPYPSGAYIWGMLEITPLVML